MGIEVLISSAIALLYPAAKRVAGPVADGFLADLSEDAYESAGNFWTWLRGKWSNNAKGSRALADVEADPDDEVSREVLRARLTQAAQSDEGFRAELEEQIMSNGAAVNVLISVEEMQDVTGLVVGEFRSGAAHVVIRGETAKNVTGAHIEVIGGA